MARFNYNDADNYGGGSNNYFSLKDNGDTARVRFLYNDMNDIFGVAVHQVEVDGKMVDVECLRTYNEPLEKCPFCSAGLKISPKLYIPIFDLSDKSIKYWTRGKKYFNKLSSLCSRYNPLVSTVFEIERVGKTGDKNTIYEIYPINTDDAKLTDFEEVDAEGITYQRKTVEEMNYFLDNQIFPDNAPQTRNSIKSNRQNTVAREMPVRRRPNYNNEESF